MPDSHEEEGNYICKTPELCGSERPGNVTSIIISAVIEGKRLGCPKVNTAIPLMLLYCSKHRDPTEQKNYHEKIKSYFSNLTLL